MFIDKTSGDIVVECGKFEGEDSIDPTEPHNIFVGSWLDKLVQQFFLTSQQQDLLPDTQKQLYSIATTQNATIVWDQHTCDVDPKTDGGMWHNYVQSMFEKYVPSDWAGLTTNDNKDHEMSCFVRSFAIHVLKMSEHKIKKTALTYTSSSDTAIQMNQLSDIHQWNIRITRPKNKGECVITYKGVEVPCNCISSASE
jgi:predicted secreted protein